MSLTGDAGEELSKTASCRVKTGTETGVERISGETDVTIRYDISGRRIGTNYRGLAIEKKAYGSVRKIIVK